MAPIKAKLFFYEHAGYSYQPETETATQGRARCALALANAEAEASARGFSYEWELDNNLTNRDWTDESPQYATWCCVCRDESGDVRASLCGIDFGHTGDAGDEHAEARQPWSDPYRRVVQAELALEALAAA